MENNTNLKRKMLSSIDWLSAEVVTEDDIERVFNVLFATPKQTAVVQVDNSDENNAELAKHIQELGRGISDTVGGLFDTVATMFDKAAEHISKKINK